MIYYIIDIAIGMVSCALICYLLYRKYKYRLIYVYEVWECFSSRTNNTIYIPVRIPVHVLSNGQPIRIDKETEILVKVIVEDDETFEDYMKGDIFYDYWPLKDRDGNIYYEKGFTTKEEAQQIFTDYKQYRLNKRNPQYTIINKVQA